MKQSLIRRFLREPLTHFLFLGLIIFVGYHIRGNHSSHASDKIVVTEAKIDNLINTFARSWNRPPTQEELNGLIRDYIREEVCVREAIALGLDRDDTVIRRRLRQKMDFMIEDVAARTEPADQELVQYMNAHQESFRSEGQISFQQIYFNPQLHGTQLDSDVQKALGSVKIHPAMADEIGDPILLDHSFESISLYEISNQFGEKFSKRLQQIPVGKWIGPIESGLGVHLVFIRSRIDGKLPPFQDVRDQVKREWVNAKRLEMNEKAYEELLARYSVVIEPPSEAKKQIAQVRR